MKHYAVSMDMLDMILNILSRRLIFFAAALSETVLMPPTDNKADPVICTMIDPFEFPYTYYQTRVVVLGVIATQLGCVFDKISFNEHPRRTFADEML